MDHAQRLPLLLLVGKLLDESCLPHTTKAGSHASTSPRQPAVVAPPPHRQAPRSACCGSNSIHPPRRAVYAPHTAAPGRTAMPVEPNSTPIGGPAQGTRTNHLQSSVRRTPCVWPYMLHVCLFVCLEGSHEPTALQRPRVTVFACGCCSEGTDMGERWDRIMTAHDTAGNTGHTLDLTATDHGRTADNG